MEKNTTKISRSESKKIVKVYLKSGRFELIQENGQRKWVHKIK